MTYEVKYEGYVHPTTCDLVNLFSMFYDQSYWCDVQCEKAAYKAAKERLKADVTRHDEICIEDVLVNILDENGALDFYDFEEDEHHEIKLSDLLNGIGMYVADTGNIDMDDWDGISADCIMQYATFGEVIYG